MANLPDQRLVESPIFQNSIEGLQSVLGMVAVDYGQPPIPVAVVPSSFAQREVAKILGGDFKYPFMAITLQRVTHDTTGYNNNLSRQGISVTSNDKILTYKLRPVIATFRVRYFTQDNGELLNFSTRWITRQKDMQFKLANDKLVINIKVRMNDDLGVPEQDITDWGNIFQLETDCEIATYTGDIETSTKITQVNLTTNLWDRTNKIPVSNSKRIFKIKPPEQADV